MGHLFLQKNFARLLMRIIGALRERIILTFGFIPLMERNKSMSLMMNLLQEHLNTIGKLQSEITLLEEIGRVCAAALKQGRRIFFMGNGGSAADAQHLAAEFVGRFEAERQPLPAMALTTDSSILTAVSNDYGYDEVFVRQVAAWVQAGDIVFGISTSGNSPSVVKAITLAQAKGAVTIGFTGAAGGQLKALSQYCFCVPSNKTARIQEAHILAGHLICAYCDEAVTSGD